MNILIYIAIFTLGSIIGSFLNVCIFRVPKRKDIIFENSHCMGCGKTLKWFELIPVFSFIIQKGKCRNCRIKLSWQYPLVELVNGVAYVWIYYLYGTLSTGIITTVLYGICTSALIVLTVIDWRTFEIPVGCNVIIGILGIIMLFTDLVSWHKYILGFFAVSSLFLLIYILTKGRGIGGGDIKLMAAAGLLLGWQNIILAMVLGCVVGSIIHLVLMKIKGKDRLLAFGPYLSFGIFAAMLYGEEMINWYLNIY